MRTSRCVCLVGLLALLPLIVPLLPVARSGGPLISSALAEPVADRVAPPRAEDGIILTTPAGLESVLGREVRTAADHDLGRIIDVLADREGRVRAVVIEFGGFLGIGTRKIAVDWSALYLDGGGERSSWLVDVRREQVRAAPEYKPNAPFLVPRASN
jgi:hypothetical protein